MRWWNVKHPTAYAHRLDKRQSPAAGRETLDVDTREFERIMLVSRLSEGLPIDTLAPVARRAVAGLIAEELIDPVNAFAGTLVLTLKGRLLGDAVTRALLG